MNEDRKKECPGCGRHCDVSAPGCERGETYARSGRLPERPERGGPGPGTGIPGRFRHYGPAEGAPERPGPHGPGPRETALRQPGPLGPQDRRPPHPRGKLTESPRYQAEDGEGKLLALFRALGHAGQHLDEKSGQGRVLGILREEGEMTQRALTERLGIQPGSASELLSKLERAGFLVRTPSLTDRRTADVSLTPEGERRAAESGTRAQARRAEMFAVLNGEEKEQLRTLLEKLCDAWEEQRGPGKPRL